MRSFMFRSLFTILVLLAMLTLLSCTDSADTAAVPVISDTGDSTGNSPQSVISQKYLFEAYYVNFAWGYQHHGIVIERDGSVYRYSYDRSDEPWNPRDYSEVSEDELAQKYDHNRELIATVDRSELLQKYRLISAAARGELSGKKQAAYDMGSIVFNAFLYDANTKRYTVVLLDQTGDFEQTNQSDAANNLQNWLNSFWSAE